MWCGAVCRRAGVVLHGRYMVGTPAERLGVNPPRSEAAQTVQDQADMVSTGPLMFIVRGGVVRRRIQQ